MKNGSTTILFILILTFISCQKKVNVNLGQKYKLIASARHPDLAIVTEYNIAVIRGHILDYAFDSNFIVAAQRPRDSVRGIETMTAPKYEEAFEQSTFRQYWIIDKRKKSIFDGKRGTDSNVYGPFKKEEYLQKCKEIGVPNSLELK